MRRFQSKRRFPVFSVLFLGAVIKPAETKFGGLEGLQHRTRSQMYIIFPSSVNKCLLQCSRIRCLVPWSENCTIVLCFFSVSEFSHDGLPKMKGWIHFSESYILTNPLIYALFSWGSSWFCCMNPFLYAFFFFTAFSLFGFATWHSW